MKLVFPLQRLGCDNMLESSQQEDPCLQCGGGGQSCYRVHNSFSLQDLQTGTLHLYCFNQHTRRPPEESCVLIIQGYNQMFIIPVGATTINIRETVATRNYLGGFLEKAQLQSSYAD